MISNTQLPSSIHVYYLSDDMTLLESDKSVVQANHHVVLHYMRVNLGIQKMSHVMFLLSYITLSHKYCINITVNISL